jgi:hypothetical protein
MNRAAALGSLVFALVACSSSAAPSDPPSPGAEAPESQSAGFASPRTTPLMSAPRITWSEVEFDGYIADIIGNAARFVAVGSGGSGASAWSSSDGSGWEEHDVPEQSFGQFPNGANITAGMRSLVRLGDTLYSFGATTIFNDSSHGAGWRWTDGQAWEAIQSASEFFAGEVIVVTASDEALVASTVTFGGPRGTLATWRWTPTTSWVRTSLPPEMVVGALTWADGTFLAAGSSVASATDAQPSIWISADGLDWSSVETPDGMSNVCALTFTTAGGFVAFGRAGDRIAAWTSTDGAAWIESTMEHADASGITDDTLSLPAACSVVAADGGLVAVMQVDDALIWTSRDGVSWEFQEALELSGVRVAATGQVPLAAVGRHVLLADTRSDPTESDGLRQVVFVGVIEP